MPLPSSLPPSLLPPSPSLPPFLPPSLLPRQDLPYIVTTASNTWGLFILSFLLGYGLVEVPRSLLYSTRYKYSLNHCYFHAAKLYIDMAEANEDLQEVTEVSNSYGRPFHCDTIACQKCVPDPTLQRPPEKVRGHHYQKVSSRRPVQLQQGT